MGDSSEVSESIESRTDPAAANPVRSDSRWTSRRAMWTASFLGICLPVAWVAWTIFGWPGELRISRETTWLTEPVAEDGYIDYLPHVRARHIPLGVGPTEDDHWLHLDDEERPATPKRGLLFYQDPVFVIPESQMNANSDEVTESLYNQNVLENEIVPRLQFVPWTAKQYPKIAAVVERNEAWYADVFGTFTDFSAVTYPQSSSDRDNQGVAQIMLPSTGINRVFANRFLLRSSLRFGSGQVDEALQDIQFVYQIANRDRLFLIGHLMGNAIENAASRSLVAGLLNADEFSATTVQFVDQLPIDSNFPQVSEIVDAQSRLMHLEMLQNMHRNPQVAEFLVKFKGRPSWHEEMLVRRFRNAVDWNEILKAENAYIDRVVMAMSETDYSTGIQQLKIAWEATTNKSPQTVVVERELWQRRPTTEEAIQCLPGWHGSNWGGDSIFESVYLRAHERLLRRRVVQVVARLALWRQLNGEFPADLDSLKSVDGFTRNSDNLYIDPFTGKPLIYRKTETGFELISCGSNGVEDGSSVGQLDYEAPTSATGLTADDLVWCWPLEPVSGD